MTKIDDSGVAREYVLLGPRPFLPRLDKIGHVLDQALGDYWVRDGKIQFTEHQMALTSHLIRDEDHLISLGYVPTGRTSDDAN